MPILIVDDEPILRTLLADSLHTAGYEVAVAPDGESALTMCRRVRLDLIVADWIMPGMDGVELCRRLKADPALRSIYVILLTAREGLADKVTALDAGADDYVVKPYAEGELLARVRAGLRIHRLQDELAQLEWRLATRELAAALGHTINNPLQAIANYLGLLERSAGAGAGAAPETLAGARREVERIAGIIRRLVDLRDPRRLPTTLGTYMTDLGATG